MNRRKFLKLAILSTTATAFVPSPANAFSLWGSDHLDELIFSEVFPKPLYQKSYFSYLLTGASIFAGIVMSALTAGAGAPVAAEGVSAIASWIGGGGAGSYMAGLSTVGGWFGGNAMLGAAILNGISLGTIGGAAGKANLLMAEKAVVAISLTDTFFSGISMLKDSKNNRETYVFDLRIPEDIGSDSVRKLVDEIYELEDKKMDLIKDIQKSNNNEKVEVKERITRINEYIQEKYKKAVRMLRDEFYKRKPSQENLLVLGVIAYKAGDVEDFKKALNYIDTYYSPEKKSYLNYLKGVAELASDNPNIPYAFKYFAKALKEEPYVIETATAMIELLGNDYKSNRWLMIKIVNDTVKHYDSDKYESRYNLSSFYYKVAAIAFRNKDYKTALEYFEKSYDELGFLIKHLPIAKDWKNQIKVSTAVCYARLGRIFKAREIAKEVIDSYDSDDFRIKQYKEIFHQERIY